MYLWASLQCGLADGQQQIAAWRKKFLQHPLSLLSFWLGQNSHNGVYGIHDDKCLGTFQTVPQFLADEGDKETIRKKESSLFKWSVGGLDSRAERQKDFLNVVLENRTSESFILQTLVTLMAEFYRTAMTKKISLASHAFHRERKGLVMLQLSPRNAMRD